MKKIISLIITGFAVMAISCGPSAEEKAQMEQQRLDSINAVVEQQRQDSIAFAERAMQDSIAAANQAVADSIRMKAVEDSIAAAQKVRVPKKKTQEQIKKEEVKKATQGRG